MSTKKSSQKANAVSKTPASKTPTAKVAAVTEFTDEIVSDEIVSDEKVEKKLPRTRDEIFAASLDHVKSTGNPQVDTIAKKILSAIHSKEMPMEACENGFTGMYNEKAPVSIVRQVVDTQRVGVRETARYVLTVGEGEKKLELGGQFAAKTFRLCNTVNNVKVSSVSFNENTVASIAALLD